MHRVPSLRSVEAEQTFNSVVICRAEYQVVGAPDHVLHHSDGKRIGSTTRATSTYT